MASMFDPRHVPPPTTTTLVPPFRGGASGGVSTSFGGALRSTTSGYLGLYNFLLSAFGDPSFVALNLLRISFYSYN